MDKLATGSRPPPIFREHLTSFEVMIALTTVTSLVVANPQFVPTHTPRVIR